MLAVSAELVEINAVCTRMRENAVKYYIYTVFFRFFAKIGKILVCAEHRIDMLIAGGRIAVILMRLEYRVKIYAGHAQLFKIGQFLFYALEVACEVVIVAYYALFIGAIVRCVVPVRVDYSVGGNIFVFFAASAESVGENLIHYSALYPFGRRHILVKYRQLKQLSVVKHAQTCSASLDISSVAVNRQREIIVMKSRMLRIEIAGEHITVRRAVGQRKRNKTLFFTGAEHNERRIGNIPFLRKTQSKGAWLKLSYCSERAFIICIKAVEYRSIH